ncbi:MAG: hypothetical protein RL616_300 [Verrucomicrobiota bacterium]|jgi:hypothetical protein
MKTNNLIIVTVACAAALTITGCSKSETPVKDAVAPATDAAKSLTEKVTDTAKDAAAKVTDAAKNVAASVTDVATNTVAAVSSPFNDGLASAKKAIADKDYTAALAELNKLSSLKLSDEQTKVVDGLKTDVQAMLSKATGGATDAVKGLLGK